MGELISAESDTASLFHKVDAVSRIPHADLRNCGRPHQLLLYLAVGHTAYLARTPPA